MASGAVWGIDIGQCALKALRCRVHEESNKVIADAFDYIEYPKILSQPGSDPAELIGEALKQFLSRNSVLDDRVAISVSGQAGLARFIKLPPVEAKKIPDIVRYEARQQIPFDLNDVIWDYQRMGGGSVEEGFALETEIGLFAMKREAVFRALDPFIKSGIEVDIVQLTPLVLYNLLVFDQLGELPSADEYDPENPPESMVVISLGTDATDLVISNGFRVWQRSVPLGGSHFTKVLTKELKLTFAKAEHLKRNATTAPDPKAVFQAMRPVFSDLLTELQRSISYFSNLDRSAKIGRVIALGNAMKLPGLRRYLSQSLGFEIEKIDSFRGLVGSQVVTAPSFQENLLSFGVAYGLALQGLGKGSVRTNLLPKEIIQDRLIKRKKPWAVTAAAVFLLGCSISFAAYSMTLGTVDANSWKPAEDAANQLAKDVSKAKTDASTAEAAFKETDLTGQHLVGNVEGRIRWLELLKALNACLPSGVDRKPTDKDPLDVKIALRKELHITNLECQWMEDVAPWYENNKQYDEAAPKPAAPAAGATDATGAAPAPAPGAATGAPGAEGAEGATGPKGPGWIISLSGHHYHNADRNNQGPQYIRKTLLANLRNGKVKLPASDPDGGAEVTMKEFGISYPLFVNPLKIESELIANPYADKDAPVKLGGDAMLGGLGASKPKAVSAGVPDPTSATISVPRFDFNVQFCWQPKTPTMRLAEKKAAEKKAKEAAAAAAPQQ